MSGTDAEARPPATGAAGRLAARLRPHLVPIAVLVLCLGLTYGEIWRTGVAEVMPLAPVGKQIALPDQTVADETYGVWLVARHAHTLITRPWRLFDTEHCAPEDHSLTYGIHMFSMGVLAIPAALFTGEPVAVYNAALAASSAVAAACMYALGLAWTGRRSAGLVAALLFAFHPIRIEQIAHPTEWDMAGFALALYFAERLFAHGRWRDAMGLGLAGALLVATSYYSLFTATLLALPMGLWLWLRRVPRRLRLAQLVASTACVATAAALLLGPYLAARSQARIGDRSLFLYANWGLYEPGGPFFLGWLLLLLAAVGLGAPRRFAFARVGGEPRPALLAAALGVAWIAAGPATAASLQQLGLPLPDFDPHAVLARVVPGLDSVRVVARFAMGVHLVACVLAAAGTAALAAAAARLGRAGRAAPPVVAALALLACFGAPIPRPVHWQLEAIRPSQASIDFFAALAAQGNQGPMLEVPMEFLGDFGFNDQGPKRVLLSAWHHRRTSACFGSYQPPERSHLNQLASALPQHDSVSELRRLGFTTLVVHHESWLLRTLAERTYERGGPGLDRLRLLHRSENMSAYALEPEATDGK